MSSYDCNLYDDDVSTRYRAGYVCVNSPVGNDPGEVRLTAGHKLVDGKVRLKRTRDDGEPVRKDQNADNHEQRARRQLNHVVVLADAGERGEKAVDGKCGGKKRNRFQISAATSPMEPASSPRQPLLR